MSRYLSEGSPHIQNGNFVPLELSREVALFTMLVTWGLGAVVTGIICCTIDTAVNPPFLAAVAAMTLLIFWTSVGPVRWWFGGKGGLRIHRDCVEVHFPIGGPMPLALRGLEASMVNGDNGLCYGMELRSGNRRVLLPAGVFPYKEAHAEIIEALNRLGSL